MSDNLNTAETDEYKEWLSLMKEIQQIHGVLKENPNVIGLKIARSHAYNILADIQNLLELAEQGDKKPAEDNDPLEGIKLN